MCKNKDFLMEKINFKNMKLMIFKNVMYTFRPLDQKFFNLAVNSVGISAKFAQWSSRFNTVIHKKVKLVSVFTLSL